VIAASSDKTFPARISLIIPLMSESSCYFTNYSIISSRVMILNPYFSFKLRAKVDFPLLVLPIMKIIGANFTSLGTA
jgi:hypothetical protein